MGKIKIKVNVIGGVAPVPIQVRITERDRGEVLVMEKGESFEETIYMPPGEYVAIVSGQNHTGGKTEISLTGKSADGDSFNLKKTKKEKYSASFMFKI